MVAAPVDILFNARQRFDRFEVEFYGHEGQIVPLAKKVQNAFKKDIENAKIFRQIKTGKRGTLNELVIYFSKEKGVTKENVIPDSVKKSALAGGKATYAYRMEFDVEPDAYSMETDKGELPIRQLNVWLEYTVTPKKQ